MIRKIYISYSRGEEVTYCFWKYFFQICGIWLEDIEIETAWDERCKDIPRLLILGKDDRKNVLPEVHSNYVYLVKNNSGYKNVLERPDVVGIGQWDKNENEKVFLEVLEKLLERFEEQAEIRKLLEIYMEEKLWNVLWLYHEAVFRKDSPFNGNIVECCERVLKRAEAGSGWHFDFMNLHVKYIYSDVSYKNLIDRVRVCDELLEKCTRMSRTQGWVAQLCMLAAKICGFSHTQQKYAASYYRSIPDLDKNAEVYYRLGRVFEKVVGNSEHALFCYRLACERDKKCFQAAYKLAMDMQNHGNWMEAYQLYVKVRSMLAETVPQEITSVREIEYYYKSTKRIILICRKYIIGDRLITRYNEELKELIEKLKGGEPFSKILRCMFGKQRGEEIKKQILGEILERFIIECSN